MNHAASIFRRLNIRELVSSSPIYSSVTGKQTLPFFYIECSTFYCVYQVFYFIGITFKHELVEVSGEGLTLTFRRWATKKTAGSTKNGRDSKPKNLGVKKFGGEVRRILLSQERDIVIVAIFFVSFPC